MTGIQDLPSELLLQILELCGSDLLSLIKAYPTALNTFSRNRKAFVARLSARFGDLALLSLERAARLRYIRRQPDFQTLHYKEIEARIEAVFMLTKDTSFGRRNATLPNLDRYPLSALCIMQELGEDAKAITDAYSQQALAEMASKPDAELYIPRQSTELTQNERKRFMTSAFVFESYCLTFFHGQRLLFCRDEFSRESFLGGPLYPHDETGVGRFYCIMYYLVQKHRELLSSVTQHIELIHGRPSSDSGRPREDEYTLWAVEYDWEREVLNYLHFLTSQGLKMLTTLQKMSIDELTSFTKKTFLRVNSSDQPTVLINRLNGYGTLGTHEARSWLPWPYLYNLFDNRWGLYHGEEDWKDTWGRAIPFWDPSEDEDPYGRRDVMGWSPLFWFVKRGNR
ncbi:hypothetical protein NW768_006807 [Fusarium equiseti]|uniref:F-box domain-containing protein n=1 Tax=Fusarium equiseti TaxID=61235 RepID=A0ABQ8R984_FUSEQ|nr:hypothetical protein NW768_006807 [Fusarium equiseti]